MSESQKRRNSAKKGFNFSVLHALAACGLFAGGFQRVCGRVFRALPVPFVVTTDFWLKPERSYDIELSIIFNCVHN